MASVEQNTSGNRIGQVLHDKWVIERLVGEGGMAAVYAARHRNGAVVALKILHPEISQREDIRERFLLEARAANRVAHPGVVKVHDDNIAQDGAVFLVMELLEGETVLDRANRALVDPLELLRWMDEVLDVLAAAHAAGIVHRDLKPDNIFLTTEGRVKVLDFGIARVSDALPRNFRTRTGTALGTGPYMSPEQALGKLGDIDGRSDLFSVGATMFRLTTRRRVHEVDKESDLLMAMATMPAPPIATFAPTLPRGIAAIIDRSLAFLPSRRYPDARTMQADVRAVLRGESPPYATAQLLAGREPWATREDPSSRPGVLVARPVAPTVPEHPVSPAPASAGLPAPAPTAHEVGAPPAASRPVAQAPRSLPATVPEAPARATQRPAAPPPAVHELPLAMHVAPTPPEAARSRVGFAGRSAGPASASGRPPTRARHLDGRRDCAGVRHWIRRHRMVAPGHGSTRAGARVARAHGHRACAVGRACDRGPRRTRCALGREKRALNRRGPGGAKPRSADGWGSLAGKSDRSYTVGEAWTGIPGRDQEITRHVRSHLAVPSGRPPREANRSRNPIA